MSINHYSPTATDLSETQLWSHYVMESTAKTSSSHHQYHHNPFMSAHHLLPSSTATFCLTDPHARTTGGGGGRMFNAGFSFNLNNEDEEELAADEHSLAEEIRESSSNHSNNGGNPRELLISSEQDEIPKEPLFEKPLTPSDVGKLNRLVIPKQHAEKHFPLNGGGGAAAAESGENGLLLSFEDEVGKSWRFRYSYWNSSQSYVLTKGWSRFVKEKRLDAGDIVVFSRLRGDSGLLFIGWRRRNSNGGSSQSTAAVGRGGGGWNRQMFYSGQQYPYQTQNQAGPHSLSYQPECLHAGSIVQNQTPSASGGNSKTTLRLFGVNLECQSEPSTPVGSPMSGQAQDQAQAQAHYHHQYYSNNHMDISFSGSGDVYRQG